MSDDIKPQESSKQESAKKAPNDFREKVTQTIVGFIITGILGGLITTWIQQRAWNWQNRITGIQKDMDDVFSTYKSASELLNGSWLASYRIANEFLREQNGAAARTSARADYDAADREWGLHYANVARDMEFYVDAPFAIEASKDIDRVWTYNCPGGPHRAGVGSQSARVLLETINHCQDDLKSKLESLIEPAPNARRLDQKERQALIDALFRHLDQLYRTNSLLRCVLYERATVIRGTLTQESYWSAFFGIDKPTYQPLRKIEECEPER